MSALLQDGEVKALHLRTSQMILDTKAMISHSRGQIERRDNAIVKQELEQAARVNDIDNDLDDDDDDCH